MTIGLRVHFRHISLLTVYSNVRTWHTADKQVTLKFRCERQAEIYTHHHS